MLAGPTTSIEQGLIASRQVLVAPLSKDAKGVLEHDIEKRYTSQPMFGWYVYRHWTVLFFSPYLKVGSINYHRNKNIKSWVTFCHLSDSLRLKLPVHSVVMPA